MFKRVAIFFVAVLLPTAASAATPPTCNISVPPKPVYANQNMHLVWFTTGAETASLDHGIGPVPLQGSIDAQAYSTYTMTVTSASGNGTCSVQVQILQPQIPSYPTSQIQPQQTLLYRPTALPVQFMPYQVSWAPVRAPYSTGYYDTGYDWYVHSPQYTYTYTDVWYDKPVAPLTKAFNSFDDFGSLYSYPTYDYSTYDYSIIKPNGDVSGVTYGCDYLGCDLTGTRQSISNEEFERVWAQPLQPGDVIEEWGTNPSGGTYYYQEQYEVVQPAPWWSEGGSWDNSQDGSNWM